MIIPESPTFDQSTLATMLMLDPVCQRYRDFFAVLDWSVVADADAHRRGHRPHPESAYLKAFLLKIHHGFEYCTQLRTSLLDHPLLVLELGFHPVLDPCQPYGFDVARTVPTDRWWREKQRRLDPHLLTAILASTIHMLREEIPGLGEVVAIDVTHIYAWVHQNNPRAYVKDRFCKEHQPTGDPDCRVGVKKSTNQQHPDGSKKEVKEYLWGYGSGVASCTDPVYGDVILAELTQPFNETDVTFFETLYWQTVRHLDFFPTHLTADAAYDAWYVYEHPARHGGIGAVPLNERGHDPTERDPDGVPLCPMGLRMIPSFQFQHTQGYTAQRFRCPLLFPQPLDFTCSHAQFAKGPGCIKDPNWQRGGLQRVLLDRDGPLYHAVYCQRTSCERINSHSKSFDLARPKVRNGRSVAHLTTLTYILINLKALHRAKSINRSLLGQFIK